MILGIAFLGGVCDAMIRGRRLFVRLVAPDLSLVHVELGLVVVLQIDLSRLSRCFAVKIPLSAHDQSCGLLKPEEEPSEETWLSLLA